MSKPLFPPDFDELSLDEKIARLQQLWDVLSQDPSALQLTDAQEQELRKRMEEHRKHPDQAIPWENVLARLRE